MKKKKKSKASEAKKTARYWVATSFECNDYYGNFDHSCHTDLAGCGSDNIVDTKLYFDLAAAKQSIEGEISKETGDSIWAVITPYDANGAPLDAVVCGPEQQEIVVPKWQARSK